MAFRAALARAVAAGQFTPGPQVESLSRSVPPMVGGAVLVLQSLARLAGAPQDGAAARRSKADALTILMAGLRAGADATTGDGTD